MKNNEIVGLNQIWARRNLDIGFFFEQILPQMEANFQLGEASDSIERVKECDLFVTFLDFPFYGLFLVRLLKPKKVLGLYRSSCNSSIEAYKKMCLELGIEFNLCEFDPTHLFFCVDMEKFLPDPRIMRRDANIVLDISACSAMESFSSTYNISAQKKGTEAMIDKELFLTRFFIISVVSTNLAPKIPWGSNCFPVALPPKSLGREFVTICQFTLGHIDLKEVLAELSGLEAG